MNSLNFLIAFIFVLIVGFVYADEVNFSDCGSSVGEVTKVLVSDCDKSMRRCAMKRNKNATVEIYFNSKGDSDSLEAVVHGILLDVPVPFSIPNPDGCLDSGIECPVQNGRIYSYSQTLPVLQKYPRVTVDVKWELQGADKKDYVCVIIPAKIT